MKISYTSYYRQSEIKHIIALSTWIEDQLNHGRIENKINTLINCVTLLMEKGISEAKITLEEAKYALDKSCNDSDHKLIN